MLTAKKSITSRSDAERGAILVLTAICMIVLLLIAAFATDLGAWYRQGQEQQRAADVASLNGIQAYDAALKEYIANTPGADSFDQLTSAQQAEAEQEAMQAALDAITGALAAGGVNVTTSPVVASAAPPLTSTATFIADDGSDITVTRNAANELIVSVTQQGDQYFSNFVRDAPTITREGSSVISNCNADCSRDIVLEPPFRGFDARGDGDGWAPLLRGNSEIWAVNHHSYTGVWEGSVVCMDRATEDFCNFTSAGASKPGLIPLAGYRTHTRASDLIDNSRNKIFFTARHIDSQMTGVVCVDMAARGYCSTPFVALWPYPLNNDTNAVGPVLWNGDLYVVAQDGHIACVDPDTMTQCGEWTMSANAHGSIPSMSDSGKTNNLELVGDKLYVTLALNNGATLFECWNLVSASSCWGTTQTASHVGAGSDRFTFLGFSSGGTPTHICAANKNGRNSCASLTSGAQHENAALRAYLPALNVGWIGDTFAIVSDGQVRTLFGGGLSNKTVCFDWKTNSGCGVVNHPTYTAATLPSEPDGAGRDPAIGGSAVEPYAYAQVTEDCVVGLGDESNFFTLTVDTMQTCIGSSVTTDIYPCPCGDGSTFRYGVLALPPELVNVLDTAVATVSGGGITETGDLLFSPMDLSSFDGVDGPLSLTIEVASKVNDDGKVLWTQPFNANLSLTVQPTLAQ